WPVRSVRSGHPPVVMSPEFGALSQSVRAEPVFEQDWSRTHTNLKSKEEEVRCEVPQREQRVEPGPAVDRDQIRCRVVLDNSGVVAVAEVGHECAECVILERQRVVAVVKRDARLFERATREYDLVVTAARRDPLTEIRGR